MLCLGIEPSADDGILPSFTLSLHWSKLLLRPFYTWRAANMRKEVKRSFFKGSIIAVKWLGRWVTIPQLGISPAGLTARCITNSAHFRIKKTRRVPTFILESENRNRRIHNHEFVLVMLQLTHLLAALLGVEPRFLGWKPSELTFIRTSHSSNQFSKINMLNFICWIIQQNILYNMLDFFVTVFYLLFLDAMVGDGGVEPP